MNSPTRVPVLPPAFGSSSPHGLGAASAEKAGGSSHSRSNAGDGEITYYNVQTPSRTSNHSNDAHSHQGQGQGPPSTRPFGPPGNITLDSSSSSSSSSSSTSSDSDSVEGQLAMVPRHPPAFHPYMMGGMPPGGFLPGPYGMPPAGMGMGPQGGGGPQEMLGVGQLMLPPPPSGGMMGAQGMAGPLMLPGGGGGGGGGFGPPARYLPQDDLTLEERLQHLHTMAKNPHPLVMEHPSLRQCVIFMAIVFVLALVALIVTSIYFGRTTQTSWNV